ncbi:MAG: DUF6477 family protein [Paracoccaceae bacterium]
MRPLTKAEADPSPAAPRAPEGATRPRLLLTAARHGLAQYRRDRDLARLLGRVPLPATAARELADLEAAAEAARQAGSPLWSSLRHVDLLIALLSERALLVPCERPAP